jgi:hypothetical protein
VYFFGNNILANEYDNDSDHSSSLQRVTSSHSCLTAEQLLTGSLCARMVNS